MAADPKPGDEELQKQLETTTCQLAACRDDLGEAYAMLAKAGLDWAKAQRVQGALQVQCQTLSVEHQRAREECKSLESVYHKAKVECDKAKVELEAVQVQCTRLEAQAMEAEARYTQERKEKELLTRQLEEAMSAVAGGREALAEEGRRRETLQEAAEAALRLALQARQETEKEQHLRQSAEDAAVAALAWAAQEREGVRGEKDRLAEERRELEMAQGWREHGVRLRLHEAQAEVAERVQRIEALERAVRVKLEHRGMEHLWTEAEKEWVIFTVASLREPLFCRRDPHTTHGNALVSTSTRHGEEDEEAPAGGGEASGGSAPEASDDGLVRADKGDCQGPDTFQEDHVAALHSQARPALGLLPWDTTAAAGQQLAAEDELSDAAQSLHARLAAVSLQAGRRGREKVCRGWDILSAFSVESSTGSGAPHMEHTPRRVHRSRAASVSEGCSEPADEPWASEGCSVGTLPGTWEGQEEGEGGHQDLLRSREVAASVFPRESSLEGPGQGTSETSASDYTLQSTDVSSREFFADTSSCDDQSAAENAADLAAWYQLGKKPAPAKRGPPHLGSRDAVQPVGRHTVVNILRNSRWF